MLYFILMTLRSRFGLGSELDDEELMELYREGDLKAFRTLMKRHERKVYNFIFRFIGDRERANDLLQETFLRVVKQRGSYTRRAKFTTWIFTMARNLSIDELRKRKHRRHKSLQQPTSSSEGARTLLEKLPGSSEGGFDHTDAQEIKRRVGAAIDELSDEQREVFVMRQMQQLPFREIAEIIGEKENTVKSRMRYALEHLRLALADYASELPSAVSPLPSRSQS
tara:strand:+ start:364 stop:1035 length:672 start_codon:yes stop_codon:yes gene_type:complete